MQGGALLVGDRPVRGGQRGVVVDAVPLHVPGGGLEQGLRPAFRAVRTGAGRGVRAVDTGGPRREFHGEGDREHAGRVGEGVRVGADHEGEHLCGDAPERSGEEFTVGDVRVVDVLHDEGARTVPAGPGPGQRGQQEVHEAVRDP